MPLLNGSQCLYLLSFSNYFFLQEQNSCSVCYGIPPFWQYLHVVRVACRGCAGNLQSRCPIYVCEYLGNCGWWWWLSGLFSWRRVLLSFRRNVHITRLLYASVCMCVSKHPVPKSVLCPTSRWMCQCWTRNFSDSTGTLSHFECYHPQYTLLLVHRYFYMCASNMSICVYMFVSVFVTWSWSWCYLYTLTVSEPVFGIDCFCSSTLRPRWLSVSLFVINRIDSPSKSQWDYGCG